MFFEKLVLRGEVVCLIELYSHLLIFFSRILRLYFVDNPMFKRRKKISGHIRLNGKRTSFFPKPYKQFLEHILRQLIRLEPMHCCCEERFPISVKKLFEGF